MDNKEHVKEESSMPEEHGASAETLESTVDVEVESFSSESNEGKPDAASAEELETLRQQWLRTQADFDNFRKRTRQEKEELQKYASRKVLEELLPIVDNFDRAIAAIGDEGAAAEWKTGIDMVQRQLLGVLERFGVRPIDAVGQAFDPNLHEAVMQEASSESPSGTILQELQKGYWLHERVLRPAMVKVTV